MTTRQAVQAYHSARFRGDVPTAVAQLITDIKLIFDASVWRSVLGGR